MHKSCVNNCCHLLMATDVKSSSEENYLCRQRHNKKEQAPIVTRSSRWSLVCFWWTLRVRNTGRIDKLITVRDRSLYRWFVQHNFVLVSSILWHDRFWFAVYNLRQNRIQTCYIFCFQKTSCWDIFNISYFGFVLLC